MLVKPTTCAPCPLYHSGRGFSVASGPRLSRLLFVGEALGEDETRSGEGFTGAAGGMLSRLCSYAEIERRAARIHNVVSCQPPGNYLAGAPYEADAVEHCSRTYLAETLREMAPGSVVVALGGIPTRRLLALPKYRFTLDHWQATVTSLGAGEGLSNTGPYYVIPTYHPSFLQRGAHNYVPAVIHALRRAARIAEAGRFTPTPYRCVVDPEPAWFAAWVDDVLAQTRQDPDRLWLSIDTEFVEKTGHDEETLAGVDTSAVTLTHYNFAVDPNVGVTVPDAPEYRWAITKLLRGEMRKFLWHAPADIHPLRAAGYEIAGLGQARVLDLMHAAHLLQSDLPMNLGFWGPMAGDQPAWKHLAHTGDHVDFGVYRAFDAFVTLRVAYHVMPELKASGQLETFYRHMTDVDQYALWSSREVGLQVDKAALETFREQLVSASLSLLDKMAETGPKGTLTPKEGLTAPPKEGQLPPGARAKSATAKKRKTVDSKAEWVRTKATVVEQVVEREIQVCTTCGAEEVSVKHRCQRVPVVHAVDCDMDDDCRCNPVAHLFGVFQREPLGEFSRNRKWWHPTPRVEKQTRRVTRWFWLEPFNVDSPQQLLALILEKGHTPGTHKKTKKATTDKQTLDRLAASTHDPFYQFALDYRAVKKVLGTYVEGTLARIVRYDLPNGATIWRIHGEVTRRPSTQRTSAVNPNLQNVIADKHGKQSLAAGFRLCIVAAGAGQQPVWAYGEEGERWAREYGVGEVSEETEASGQR